MFLQVQTSKQVHDNHLYLFKDQFFLRFFLRFSSHSEQDAHEQVSQDFGISLQGQSR